MSPVVTTYDPSASAPGLPTFANDGIPGPGQQPVPADGDSAALADGEFGEEAASDTPDTPFDFDSLDDVQRQFVDSHYQQLYESQFNDRLSQAMSSRDRENNQLRGEVSRLNGQYGSVQAALNRVLAWEAQRARESGDELAYYQLRDEAMNTLATQQQAHTAQQQQAAGWLEGQFHAVNRLAHDTSIGPDGQSLFDPNEPEYIRLRDTYLMAARNHQYSTRPDGSSDQSLAYQAQNAEHQIRNYLKQRRDAALMGVGQKARDEKVKESNRNAKARAERGPMATGTRNGTSAGLSDQQAWDQAISEYPDRNDPKQFARYLMLKHPRS